MNHSISALAIVLLTAGSAVAQNDVSKPNPFPTAPPPAAPRVVAAPCVSDTKLPNGLRVLTVPRLGSGLVTVQMLVRSGAAEDPAGKSGRANMVAELLTKGTRTRSATQIADRIEQIGASLGAGASYDSTSVSLSVLKSRLGAAMPIFADVVQNPTFPAEELNRLRAQTLDDLSVAYRQPGTLARLVASRVLYGTAPYGSAISGTTATLKKIERQDVQSVHATRFSPGNSILILSGDVTAAESTTLAAKYFGGWRGNAGKSGVTLTAVTPSPRRRIVVVDRPDAGQAAVVVNRLGIKQGESNPVVPELTNDILGGGYSARLNREVRVKRGLSYGANSRLDARAAIGPLSLVTQTKNETAGEAARVLVDELARLGTDAPTAEEFAARKSALSGDFARALETGSGLAGLVGELALYNRPLSELQTYLSQVQSVTPEQVQGFAKDRFAAESANIVIVGNASQFLPDLKMRFPGEPVTVIPFNRLDLDSASLQKGTR